VELPRNQRRAIMRLLDEFCNTFLFKYYKVSVGRNFKCEGRLILQGHGCYTIGDNVYIISREFLNPVGGNRTILQTLEGGKIIIGNNVRISHAILCARESIVIDDNVLLGGGVKLYDNDFHSLEYNNRMDRLDTHIRKGKIHIKEGAFIGAHAIILKNVTVGKHSVVGAGSVVTKDIPDGEIWAGNPAKKCGITN
jgi:acetyltransferase-like isoleucine patch superfamily enzyme